MKTEVVAAIARMGVLRLSPHRLSIVKGTSPGIDEYLAQELDSKRVLIAVYIGTDRAISKPLLQVLDEEGNLLGFAKIGSKKLTKPLVRGEGATLKTLEELSFRSITTPRVLHAGEWLGNEVLVQEALQVDTHGTPNASQLALAMREVSKIGGRRSDEVATSTYLKKLRGRIERVPGEWRSRLSTSLDDAVRASRATPVVFGAWHGDWAPWNMAPAGDKLAVWDWEHFACDVPVGFDAIHHIIAAKLVNERQAPVDAISFASTTARHSLTDLDVDPAPADLVMALYLLEVGTRYLIDGEHEAGTRLGSSLNEWLIPAIDEAILRHQKQFE